MILEHTFENEDDAKDVWALLDRFGYQRNRTTVAFREGRRVYIRPEYASPALSKELQALVEAVGETAGK